MNVTESEDQAQRLIFDWARWQQGKYPQLKAMYHAANEGKRSARAGAELKRQGMKPGVSDICLPYASGKYNNFRSGIPGRASRQDLGRDSKRDHERTELGTAGIHTSN